MDVRVFLFLLVLSTGWCCNARLVIPNLTPIRIGINSELQINVEEREWKVEAVEEVGRNKELCTLCEEFAALAIGYLNKNKTQTEIISILHKTCSKLLNLEQQCIALVDVYAPLFFLEVSTVQPKEFCGSVDLCEKVVSFSQHRSKGNCEFCHNVVTEALAKLEDPDTKLDILELLLKACDAVEDHLKKCKRLVFQYAPLILLDAEKFMEKNDICTMLHACSPDTTTTEEAPSSVAATHSAD
jgi:saposin